MRLDSMNEFLRRAMSRDPVIPPSGHMHARIEEKHTVCERIAASKIVEEPPIDAIMLAKHPLDVENSLFVRWIRHDRHLIVVVLGGQ